MAEGSEQVVMADPPLVIAYPPIQRIIKQEIPPANSVEEENLHQSTLQVYSVKLISVHKTVLKIVLLH